MEHVYNIIWNLQILYIFTYAEICYFFGRILSALSHMCEDLHNAGRIKENMQIKIEKEIECNLTNLSVIHCTVFEEKFRPLNDN